jgi:hypothetical protein
MSRSARVIEKSGRWWVGWIEEIPGVNCQERTRTQLLAALKITLRDALDMNRQVRRRPVRAGRRQARVPTPA